MEPTATLITLAEVSVAVVGFAGVVSVLRGDSAPGQETMRQWRLRFMVTTGTLAVAFCLLPLPLLAYGVPPGSVWSGAGALLALANIATAFWLLQQQRDYLGQALYRPTRFNDGIYLAVLAIATFLLLGNIAGLAGGPRFAPYLVGVIIWLLFAVNTFFRMILASSSDRPRSDRR